MLKIIGRISAKTQILIAIGYFFIAALFGVFLRALHVFDIDVNYRFFVHGHSHIALLGWMYLVLTSILYHCFIPVSSLMKRKNNRIFLFTQITLIGMMILFPFQGYALFSILFSTLFLFASYWFTLFFLKNTTIEVKAMACFPYIKASLYYLVISSIGPWALGGIMSFVGSNSIWYRLAIYFYLHFQYNAWMLLALIGLLIFVFEKRGIKIRYKQSRIFLVILNISIVLTFFLSALWTKPPNFIFGLSILGAFLQIFCFAYGIYWIRKKWAVFQNTIDQGAKRLIYSCTILLGAKLSLQFLGSFPYFANLGASIIEFTIAYLHWIFLGLLSLSVILVLNVLELYKIPRILFISYLLGFCFTEGLLIYKGILIWSQAFEISNYFNEFLLFASLILVISIGLILIDAIRKRGYEGIAK